NALDYLEDLAKDERPYLDGRAVGLISTAYGDQASVSTLLTLRGIVHALRGWPTPMGATIRTHHGLFSPEGECLEEPARLQLELVGQQTFRGARALASLDAEK
ncbi:MAG TPA: NADPH-dependent oxidoreductase, partial [Erythrobacter sp.]|nr:NADPH-dependent oxidoreductase [Erythrobacter sp.]